jgi:PAS domain S-box-containing protein
MMLTLIILPWIVGLVLLSLWWQAEQKRRVEKRQRRVMSDDLLRINRALESASDAIGLGDMEANSIYHNRAHRELFGYTVEELNKVDRPGALFADPQVAAAIHTSIRAGRSWAGETELCTKAGRVIPAFVRADIIRDEAGVPIGIFGVFTDITERRAAERALAEERERSARAQRLESLGLLAGGVAHDFGNLLTIIIGNTGVLRAQPDISPAVDKRAVEIESAAWRAQELSRGLLAFARGSAPAKQRIALGPLVEIAARGATQHTSVKLDLLIAPVLAPVEADPVQIDQVISNLVVNAVQAMTIGGVVPPSAAVLVAVENTTWPHMATGTRAANPTIAPFQGSAVCITIRDTGAGIPAEVLPRIWEPFFTTKAKGTGLGLATVYAVVKKHGGMIDVHSMPGKGTTFTLVLPAAPAAEPLDHKDKAQTDGARRIG